MSAYYALCVVLFCTLIYFILIFSNAIFLLYLHQIDDIELKAFLYVTYICSIFFAICLFLNSYIGIYLNIVLMSYNWWKWRLIWDCNHKYLCAYAKIQSILFPITIYVIVVFTILIVTLPSCDYVSKLKLQIVDKLQIIKICDELQFECSICLTSDKENIVKLDKCKHLFHRGCITKWFDTKLDCPNCRTQPI